ncbi:MAG: thiamine biosynthesis protein ThiS [Lysobacterales bacterium CG02_land_8_20_14_3_00_62_12]|nr:MAG: thiamine biosynthesis protein ThiS [Xanthomonadales bacterium CG02_land_8_20_14_3_00_62_12]
MTIFLNGKPLPISPGQTVSDLLQQLGLTEQRVAVEVNRCIVARSQHASTLLHPEDRVEIVRAIGGG